MCIRDRIEGDPAESKGRVPPESILEQRQQFAVAPETVQLPIICPPLTVPSKVSVSTSAPVDVTT